MRSSAVRSGAGLDNMEHGAVLTVLRNRVKLGEISYRRVWNASETDNPAPPQLINLTFRPSRAT